MAFSTQIIVRGRVLPEAYINIESLQVHKGNIVCRLSAWENKDARDENFQPLQWDKNVIILETTDVAANNPLAYAYSRLESDDIYPNAIWNI